MRRALALCGLWLAAVGCAHEPPPRPRVPRPAQPLQACHAQRDPRAFALPVRPQAWLSLLVQLDLGRGGVYATHDCLGHAIRYRAPAACSGSVERQDPEPAPVPIARESVIERELGADTHAIWLVTHRFADGTGFGPVALVQREKTGLRVTALGTLRLPSERVQLERWTMRGQPVLVASGETCAADDVAGKSCQRRSHLALQRGDQLLDAPLFDADGRCLQPPDFELRRQAQRRLASGLQRSFELQAKLTHDARHIVVEERLVVRDVDPGAPLLPARELQHIELQRFIEPSHSRLVTRQPSLWTRGVESQTTRITPADAHPPP